VPPSAGRTLLFRRQPQNKGVQSAENRRIIDSGPCLRELAMNRRKLGLVLSLWSAAAATHAAGGLVAPAAETVWPQWQARVSLQTASMSPLTMSPLNLSRQPDGGSAQHGVQGGAILGDYYFATPSFGSFRASGGLMVGSLGGLPVSSASAGPRLGLSLNSAMAPHAALGADIGNGSNNTLPYLGLGFSGAPWRNGLAISADLGLVAGRGSALFGNQGLEGTLRELRLSPVLQLGVRYAF
jgi:hypothetical protein